MHVFSPFLFSGIVQRGPNDCVANVTISMSGVTLRISPGTVCIGCSVRGRVAADAVFQINGADISASMGRVVDGVLVLFDTESVFKIAKNVQCMSVSLNANHSVLISVTGKSNSASNILYIKELCIYIIVSQGLIITGNTTLNEGDTLHLYCDTSTLRHRTTNVKWLNSEGVVVSKNRILEIMNIHRSAAGKYTCVATQEHILNTISSVNVTVQCECQ